MRKKLSRKLREQMNTCENETALIGDYVSSSLSPRVTAAFEKHLQACPDCAAFLTTYKKTIEATRAFLKVKPARPRELVLRPAAGTSPQR
ncbi:MAG TPA: zf-HC2 domain-containing protein [Candidatus Binatia bacterium]|nr:zf-HC2 domain-containing protein [Candidatus Binatia bacterium]